MRVRLMAMLFILCLGAVGAVAQPTPDAEITLTETITSDDGTYTILYPAGWYASTTGDSEFTFANTESGLDRQFNEPVESGEVLIGVLFGSPDEVIDDLGVATNSSVVEILETALDQLSESLDAEIGDVEALSIDDRRAAAATLTLDEGDGYIALIDWNDTTMVVMMVLSAPGEREQWIPTAVEIVSSLTPTPVVTTTRSAPADFPPLTETFTHEDVALTIRYPEGWAVRDGFPNTIDVGSSDAALDQWFYDDFASGDVHVSIGYGLVAEMFEDAPPEDATPVELLEFTIEAESESDADRDVVFSEPESLRIDGREAAQARAYQETSGSYVIVIDYGDGMILIASIQIAPDELDVGEALLMDILETVEID